MSVEYCRKAESCLRDHMYALITAVGFIDYNTYHSLVFGPECRARYFDGVGRRSVISSNEHVSIFEKIIGLEGFAGDDDDGDDNIADDARTAEVKMKTREKFVWIGRIRIRRIKCTLFGLVGGGFSVPRVFTGFRVGLA
ncbi:hypothetical protein KQX54_007367 [Cotesia glomerata]|uniref:Uncharacterized protein n=1 Tax=Cotesia glomerata TaxID=32391 RepID=A0AAV7I661_COTGL|nr:hypothetical protein KQX54_007367 [Cotesia glomerata]